jgi:proteasome lid subunit RPN8/RPN11
MRLHLTQKLLKEIEDHVEKAYPDEGAGFLIGFDEGNNRRVTWIMPLLNEREDKARRNRYLINPNDMLKGEKLAKRRGLEVVGVFHSHPDHPNQPSEFDREWALPWFSYVITNVYDGGAKSSRSWRLKENRSGFEEEEIVLIESSIYE